MKLSELLSKSFKLKGGGFLNLKGFSKRVIDKEVGSSNGNNDEDDGGIGGLDMTHKIENQTIITLINTSLNTYGSRLSGGFSYIEPFYEYHMGAPLTLPDDINKSKITVQIYDSYNISLGFINCDKINTININNNYYNVYVMKESGKYFKVYDRSYGNLLTIPTVPYVEFIFLSKQNNYIAPAL